MTQNDIPLGMYAGTVIESFKLVSHNDTRDNDFLNVDTPDSIQCHDIRLEADRKTHK